MTGSVQLQHTWTDYDPFQVADIEEMNTSISTLQNTVSDSGVCQHAPAPSISRDLQSYDYILSFALEDLGKLELMVRDLRNPRSFWELGQEVQVKSRAGGLHIDQKWRRN